MSAVLAASSTCGGLVRSPESADHVVGVSGCLEGLEDDGWQPSEQPSRSAKKGMAYWLPSVRSDFLEKRIFKSTTMEGILCDCGQYADHALKAPEVLRTLLCDCGRMVDAAEFGMPDELRFADEYRDLKLHYDTARALTVQRFSTPPSQWKGHLREIMCQEALLTEGVSRTDLAGAIGCTTATMFPALGSLVNRGLLQEDKVG